MKRAALLLMTYVRRHHVGLLALFVALGGTAYAASLPRDSVGTKQLRHGAVVSSKVKDGSLFARDMADVVGVGRIEVRRVDFQVADGATTGGTAHCPNPLRGVGGGAYLPDSDAGSVRLLTTRPTRSAIRDVDADLVPQNGWGFNGWRVVYDNPAGGAATVAATAFIVCVAG